ncbi:MAG: hypothetical protein NTU62_05630 [Spirochaetes bacterium]|nr:hypothetical protein [Spirochaetota bacterium]
MRTRETFLALTTELEGDHREFLRLMEQNSRAWRRIREGAGDPIDWGAPGFTLHSVYGILENYFLRVSRFFENHLPRERWHKALVDQMALEIPQVRPALLRDDSLKRLALELLSFRRRIRNLYGEDLDPRTTSDVQAAAEEFARRFPAAHAVFIGKLRTLAEGL